MNPSTSEILSGQKKAWLQRVLAFTLLLAGSIYAVDWMNHFYQNGSVYTVYAKPLITLAAFLFLLLADLNNLEKRDWTLVLLDFCCVKSVLTKNR